MVVTRGALTQDLPAGYLPANNSLLHLNPYITKSINQGIINLIEIALCYYFTEQALNILQYLAKKSNIKINIGVLEGVNREKQKVYQVRGKVIQILELTKMRNHNN